MHAAETVRVETDQVRCAMDTLRARCISGIVVDRERTAELAQHDLGELSSIAAQEGQALATRAATSSRDAAWHVRSVARDDLVQLDGDRHIDQEH
jgi:aspartate ammonia-lyase